MSEIKKEQKFFILPLKDLSTLQSRRPKYDINHILKELAEGVNSVREIDGRPPIQDNHYITINADEPYADEVWEVILKGEREKMLGKTVTIREVEDTVLELWGGSNTATLINALIGDIEACGEGDAK